MARDHSLPRSRQSYERHNSDALRQSKQYSIPVTHAQKLLPVRGGRPAQAASLKHILELITQDDTVEWNFKAYKASGQVFVASKEQEELKIVESPGRADGLKPARPHGLLAKSGRLSEKSSKPCLFHRAIINRECSPKSSPIALDFSPNSSKNRKRNHTASIPDQPVKKPKAIDFDDSDGSSQSDADDPNDVPDESDDDYDVEFKPTCIKIEDIWSQFRGMAHLIQQKGCKKVLVAWLKVGHPKKQGNNPYNGGSKAKERPNYDKLNPGKHTAPIYWLQQDDWRNPQGADCRHREPDHVKKWERLNLFVHLLLHGDDEAFGEFNFNIEALEGATRDIVKSNPKHFRKGAEEILHELYRAARTHKSYERGEVDGETTYIFSLPQKKKAQAGQSIKIQAKIDEANEESTDDDSDATQTDQSRPTSPSSVNSGISISIKSNKSVNKVHNGAVHGLETSREPPYSHDPLSTANDVVIDSRLGVCALPQIEEDMNKNGQGSVDIRSNDDYRLDFQTPQSQNISPSTPTPQIIMGQMTAGMDSCVGIGEAGLQKQTSTLHHHHHGLPTLTNEHPMHQHRDMGPKSGPQPANPMATFQQTPTQVEKRPKPTRQPYSSSGLAGNVDDVAANACTFYARTTASTNLAPQYAQTTNFVQSPTNYPPFEVTQYSGVPPSELDYLHHEDWYTAPMDLESSMTLGAQTYNTSSSSDLIPSQAQFNQTAKNTMTQDYGQTSAANQWADVGYLQAFPEVRQQYCHT